MYFIPSDKGRLGINRICSEDQFNCESVSRERLQELNGVGYLMEKGVDS